MAKANRSATHNEKMKPPPLRYVRPSTVDEALGLLDRQSRPLAGGQSLMPLVNLRQLRVRRLVDLGAIEELQSIETGPDGELILGAGIAMSRIEREPMVLRAAPLLVDALSLVANPQIRARGTIGGNVAHGDPVSEMRTALVALRATATVRGSGGERRTPIESLDLAENELIIDLRIPQVAAGSRSAIHEVAPRYAARALVVAAAVVEIDGSLLKSLRITVGGVAPAPTGLAGLDVLRGVGVDDPQIDHLIGRAIGELPASVDPRAAQSYRRHTAASLAGRALRDAAGQTRRKRSDAASRHASAPVPPVAMQERDSISEMTITVNGRQLHPRVEPRMLLCDLLRGPLGLRATHVGCEHGVCGACNVLLDGVAVRSCLLLAIQVDGHDVQTLEGLRDTGDVEELIEAFVDGHALQCGFCTPGLMITLAELRAERSPIVPEQLLGNLCRCTGYAPIKRVAEGLG